MKKVLTMLMIAAGFAVTGVELSKESFGLLKNTPVYIQEWHIWWGFPYPDRQAPMLHMDCTLTSDREPWRLNWNRNGYPLVGLYDAANPEIIRWQIRCQKAAGLTSTAVMIHPDMKDGIAYIQEGRDNMIKTILDIAAGEKYPVFFMDEVAFRKGSVCQKPEVMAERVIRFVKKYGNHPGLYKIDGKVVYYFQTYGYKITPEELQNMFASVEKSVGPVHWMIFGSVSRFGSIPQLARIVDGANLHRRDSKTREWDMAKQSAQGIFAEGRKQGKLVTDMQYPKFDGTSQPWRQTGVYQYGQNGKFLEKTLLDSWQYKPDFIMLSSWNDWEEGANFEPGWDFDGYAGDPYAYCKVIAHLRGIEFVPPPFPAKASVHPTIWEKLNYGDGAGPVIDKIERSNVRGGALAVTARDTVNPVTALEVTYGGDLYYLAPDGGNLKVVDNKIGKLERVLDAFDFSPGMGGKVGNESVELTAPELAQYSDNFYIGVATNFDPQKPLAPVSVTVNCAKPVMLYEPIGGVKTSDTVNLAPYPRSSQLNSEYWNGWRTNVALVPRPVSFKEQPLKLTAPNQLVGLVALLKGEVNPDRVTTEGVNVDEKGLSKKFYLTLPDSVLGKPGAHFVWLRAQDAAGNWGSPVLYAVPNYEFYDRAKASEVKEAPLAVAGSLLADNCSDPKLWKVLEQNPLSTRESEVKVISSRFALGNGLVMREFPAVSDGVFTLRFQAGHLSWERLLIVWITDASGSKGYGIAWDSAKESMAKGGGTVSLLKLDGEAVTWATKGQKLKTVDSGHFAVSENLAYFTVNRNAAGEISVSVDGKELIKVKDESFKDLSRIYLRGNQTQILDDIVVSK